MRGRDGSQAGEYLDEGEEQAEEAAHGVRRFYQRAKGDSQSATKAQNDALTALQAFVGPLNRGARIVCKGRPDLLTKLGL